VDLDILLFGDEQIDTTFLTVPHPRMHLRRFVLAPLAEIAPNLLHPTFQTEIHEILANIEDISNVTRWDPNAGTEELAVING
jgi:2-amino-4-hydroxy-6-hydroxymethyldihydropteridine diphosphokinase